MLRLPRWPALRAGLVLFHVSMVVVLSLPRPGQLDRPEAWNARRVVDNFATATRWVRGLGVTLEDDALRRSAWDGAQGYLAARERALAVFLPYARAAGVGQGWRMFLTGRREGARVHIELQRDGKFLPLYVRGSDEHRWLARELDYHRFRKLCGWGVKGHDAEWAAFARWLARRAAREFPEASAIRLRAYVFAVPRPDALRAGHAPSGAFVRELVEPLEPWR